MTTKTQTTETKLRFFSVRNRLILAVLLAVILPVVVTQAVSLSTSQATLRQSISENLSTLATGQSTSIVVLLNGQIGLLQTLANNEAVQAALQTRNSTYAEDAERIDEVIATRDQRWRELVEAGETDALVRSVLDHPVSDELQKLINDFPNHVEVFITDKYGANVASTNLTSDYYQADEDWWQATWNDGVGEDYIAPEIEFDASASVYSVNMAVPVYSDAGEIIGVLRSTFQIDALIQLVTALQFGETGRALLADHEGRVLIAAGQTGTGEIWPELATALIDHGEANETQDIYTLSNPDGQTVVVDSAPLATGGLLPAIDNLEWVFVITQAEAEALAPINEAINASLAATAIIALIGVGIAFVFSRVLISPLQQLTQAAQRLGVAGDLNTRVTVESRDEFGILGRAFNAMADQVQVSIGGLETRVAERTQDLLHTIEVGRLSTSIRSQEELLPQLVEFIRSRFDLYFTQIYLLDEAGRYAILRAGTGDVGQELLARKHRLDMSETSIVARTVRDGEPVLVSDTVGSAIHKMNPLLPDTRSEVAIPLVVGGEILGVLDMQATEADTFNKGNLPVFQAMAGQIASALQGARAYDEAQAAVARAEAMNKRLAGEAWQPYLGKMARGEKAGYQYELESPKPLGEDLPRADTQATEEDLLVQPLAVSGQAIGSIVVKDDRAHTWSDEELALVEDVSERLALALDRFRSFDETETARREVTRRALEMETVAQVTTAATATLDMGELLQSVVNLTKERFGLYHVHVYLLDEAGENLVLAAGAGEAGKMMVDRGHSIPLNREGSMVATAARTREGVIANDVMQAPNFMPNPLLPNTQSEMAVPMVVGDEVVGVLDVQADIPDRFTDQDVQIQATLAGQVATAVQNARTFEESEELAKKLALVADVGRQASAIMDSEASRHKVAQITADAFDPYHIHIFLADEAEKVLTVMAGTGRAPCQHVGKNYQVIIAEETSLVTRAARERQVTVANNAEIDPEFLPSAFLSETRSQLAVPLIVGDKLIGIIDIQSDRTNQFSDEDILVQTTLAGQIATAIQNARSFEQQREMVERLQEVDRLKQQFLANMSHELRTPLNSIIGYSEVLLDGVDGDLTEDAEEDVEAIHDSGKHLLSIINEILDLAKIEAGQMQLDAQEMDLSHFVKDIVHSGQILVKDKDVALEWVEQSEVPTIEADPIRVRQVLWNLISNAVKFTEEGSVTVTYGMHSDTEVFVKVEDTGIGMTKEGVLSIFERFSQVDGSSTRRAGGTGLGLTITRQLVRMHGGEVYVESEVGVGSTFWFTLPVKVAEKA